MSTFAATSIAHSDELLEIILSFLPFEQQTREIRLVSRTFKATAHRILADKIFNKVKKIGEIGRPGGWFKAEIRKGWSKDCEDLESCIDHALNMNFVCHCPAFDDDCDFNRGSSDFISCKGKTKVARDLVDWERARELLRSKENCGIFECLSLAKHPGNGHPYAYRSSMNVRHCDQEGGGYEHSSYIENNIDKEATSSLRRFYGLHGDMPSRQFLRSLLVVLGPSTAASGRGEKKFSVSWVGSAIDTSALGDLSKVYDRFKIFVRFHTKDYGAVEILLRNKSG